MTGKTSLRTSCLYIRNGKLKVEKEENENRKENSRTALDGKLRGFKARLQLLARMYFIKVWLFY